MTDIDGRLAEIPSPPPRLRLVGDDALLMTRKALAIVGTRDPDQAEALLAYQLGAAAAARGFLVVSGLALGIDGAAHRGALSAGQTVAFLGCGLANISPRSHRGLAGEILKADGFLASEVTDDAVTRPQYLIARNRLVSGLSDATVVIASGLDGGTMHTVRFAVQQRQKVFCPAISGIGGDGVKALLQVPGSELSGTSKAFRRVKMEASDPIGIPFSDIDELLDDIDQKNT